MPQVIWRSESVANRRRIYLLVYGEDGLTAANAGGQTCVLTRQGDPVVTSANQLFRLEGALHFLLLNVAELGSTTGPLLAVLRPSGGQWLEAIGMAEVVDYDPWTAGPTAGDIRAEIDANSTALGTLLGADTTYKKGVAVANFGFYMEDATTGLPATGKTVTVQIAKDSGAFGTVAGAVTEVGSGFYRVALSSADMTADEILFKGTATGCTQRSMKLRTQS
jgi:hypothetical protein